MPRPRLVLAEIHPGMRERIAQLLERSFDLVGVVGDGRALLEVSDLMQPDVCVIDISLLGMGGIEAAVQLRELGSKAKIVFLSVHEDPDYLREALDAGGMAYVVKARMASDLCIAIKEAMAGRLFVSRSVPYVAASDPGDDAL